MSLADLLVIYLALGAPFAVYFVTRTDPRSYSTRQWIAAFSSLIFWPLGALLLVVGRLWTREKPVDEFERIRREIETNLLADRPIAQLFEFREVFYRYTGLKIAARESTVESRFRSKSPASRAETIAKRCRAHRNRRKLESHLALARGEFVKMLSICGTADPHSTLALVGNLDDPIAAESLRNILFPVSPAVGDATSKNRSQRLHETTAQKYKSGS